MPGSDELEKVLAELDRPWDGGPLSELARRELASHAKEVVRSLSDLDLLTARHDRTDAEVVITPGEPHPGNLICTRNGLVLIEWDTVATARPERDLWMIADIDEGVASAYRDLTGITLDRDLLNAYRLLWALADIAAFSAQLRGEHLHDANAEKALAALRSIFDGREPSPYGPAR